MVVKVEKPIRCTLVGDAMVGKSALAGAFVDHEAPESSYVATVHERFEGHLSVDGEKQHISILDNSGQHDYANMRTRSYSDSDVLVICYSVVDTESLASVSDFWVPEISSCSRRRKPIILVGAQTDLRTDNNDSVSTEDGEQAARGIGADCFMECSAFDMTSVQKVFKQSAVSGLKYRKKRSHFVHRIFGK